MNNVLMRLAMVSLLLVGGPVAAAPSPICVWNQAYEEDGKNDSISAILAEARGCYVLIDPFDSVRARDSIAQMKQNGNIVGCYISVGSCEDWRDDYDATKKYCGPSYPGWEGEYLVVDPDGILPLMKARIDKMATWGCDMVEFDNMDWAYDSGNGTGVTAAKARSYIQSLCSYTRSQGMKCMAKSTTEGAEDFDGLTVESYTNDKNWWSTSELRNMLKAGKIGLIVHYNDNNCDQVYEDYQRTYGDKLSFICSDRNTYRHYNAGSSNEDSAPAPPMTLKTQ
jgi:cysteinyl-tRNA synthetase